MYDFFRGLVSSLSPTRAVIDVGGVGYRLAIPLSTYEALRGPHHERREAKVLAHLDLNTNQDELRLYGFATEAERSLFGALIKIQGLGPRSALGVLSASSPSDVVRAIRDGDARFLKRIKGIGPKTADRVIIELREKAHLIVPAEPGAAPSVDDDAVRALIALGYAPQVARKAVEAAARTLDPEPPVERLIKEALQQVGR